MTAAEKTKLLAERVMGWNRGGGFWFNVDGGLVEDDSDWDPLNKLAQAGDVLEAMRAKGWHAVMLCPATGRHYCDFYRSPTDRDGVSDGHETLSAAICHAALLAEGVKEEEL